MPDVVITGDWKLVSFLREVSAEMDREIKKRAYAAVQIIRTEILNELSGQRTGRVYKIPGAEGRRRHYVRAKKPKGWTSDMATEAGAAWVLAGGPGTYIASAPGEPPAAPLGDLRRSIKAESIDRGFGEGEAIVGATMEYAPWLEFGTGRAGAAKQQEDVPEGYVHGPKPGMAPRPFLRPAIERTREQVRRVLEQRMP